jgi:ssDNA-binding replication factor A large subunit
MKVSELRPGMEHVDISVRLKSLNEPREVLTNYGVTHNLVDGVVEDETGRIGVTFWNEKLELLKGVEEGSLVELGGAPGLLHHILQRISQHQHGKGL